MEKIFYLAQVIDGVHVVGIVGLVMSIVALCFLFPFKYIVLYDGYSYAPDKDNVKVETTSRWIRRCWWILSISIIFTILVPEKKTFLFMVGGKAVDTLVEKTDIEEIPGNTINLLNEYIKAETENVKIKNSNSDN